MWHTVLSVLWLSYILTSGHFLSKNASMPGCSINNNKESRHAGEISLMFTCSFRFVTWVTTVAAEVMEHQSESPSWSMSTEELFQQSFPLHQACRDGDLEKLSALLSSGNVDLYEEDSFTGWSPLHWAANFGKVIFDFHLLHKFRLVLYNAWKTYV